jgi:hypothetical protein
MGQSSKKYDPSQDQEQAQANLQGQLQGQANLQGQLQGQGQGQGQSQTAAQALYSDSNNNNGNWNDNGNTNHNTDTNTDTNNNANTNTNHLNNDVSNSVDNSIENKVSTSVDTHVNVDVSVDVSAHTPSAPVIDLQNFSANDALIMPEVVNQTLNGGGNIFHLDQVNNLIGDTKIEDPSVSYSGSSSYDPAHGFSMDAKITGGESKIDGASMSNAVGAGAGIVSHADATLTQSAFTQTITTGANIQFNSATIQASGHDLTDDHHTL